MPRLAVFALARNTFDVPFAEEKARAAFACLDRLGVTLVGGRELLFDVAAAERALAALDDAAVDAVLLLQVTFTDATMTVSLARRLGVPVLLWAMPEPRTGGRLRLNALCGINLAAHALGRAGQDYAYLYADAAAAGTPAALAAALAQLAAPPSRAASRAAPAAPDATRLPAAATARARAARARLRGATIGRLGAHPDGFDTCGFDADLLAGLFGVEVQQWHLPDVFARAKAVTRERVAALRAETRARLDGVDDVDPDELDRALRLYGALRDLVDEEGHAALAVRCWPEMFTEYGCAACGAMARLNEERIPSACEADVNGAVVTRLLADLADAPALMVDMVDVDPAGNTAVFWHCGLAPLSMADPEVRPRAALHSNRRKPLLNEFPLKPGPITIARLSQARNETKLVISAAEMLRAPMSFSGTSGVLRFSRPAAAVLDTVMGEGLEHHYAFVYGDVQDELRALARGLALPVLEL